MAPQIPWLTADEAQHPNFSVSRDRYGRHLVVLRGELDISCEPALSHMLAKISYPSLREVVVDFGDAEFVGVGVLLLLTNVGRTFRSCEFQSLSPLLRRVLGLLPEDRTAHLTLTSPPRITRSTEAALTLVSPDRTAVSA